MISLILWRNYEKNIRVWLEGEWDPVQRADAFSKLINNTQAKKDQEHIPVIVSIPDIPDRTENIIYNGPSPPCDDRFT
ncbi:hypothetical protein MASR2M36_36250 [Providencia sp.]